VKGFFDNGGQRVFVARVVRQNASPANGSVGAFTFSSNGPGAWGNRIYVRVSDATQPSRDGSDRFRLTLLYYTKQPPTPLVDPLSDNPDDLVNPNRREPDIIEDYDNLGLDPQGANFVITTVNAASQLVEFNDDIPDDLTRPENSDYVPLADGDNGNENATPGDYLGDPGDPPNLRAGLAGLGVIDPVSLLCIPDDVNTNVFSSAAARDQLVGAMVTQCELLKDRFAIMQVERDQGQVNSIGVPRDTTYGGVYYPWIRVFDPLQQATVLVPPGGHVAGIIARTDIERGVHKAPANAVIRGIINRDLNGNKKPVEYQITKGQHDILNPKGINVIRDFRPDGRGIRLWGARTTSSDPEWKYVNVRRLFLFVEESIDEGTQWVVFEPNHEPTWAAVQRNVSAFLRSVWRSGALQGVTEEEAFFVRCDRTTMTQDDIDSGRLICLIGIAPVKPAEFVIFRISQKTAIAA